MSLSPRKRAVGGLYGLPRFKTQQIFEGSYAGPALARSPQAGCLPYHPRRAGRLAILGRRGGVFHRPSCLKRARRGCVPKVAGTCVGKVYLRTQSGAAPLPLCAAVSKR